MAILIANKGLSGRFKISGNSTGGFKARYVGVDVEAQAFFSRVTAAGGTLSATEQSAIITLVASLKAAGVWTSMKAVYPMVGASAAACAQNLKSSSFTATFSSGWTFASSGVTPNGTIAYMNTNLTPSVSLIGANFHLSYYSRTNNNAAVDFDMGVGSDVGAYSSNMFLRRSTNDAAFDSGNTSNVRITASSQINSQGFYVGSITSISNRVLIKNGSTTLASSITTAASSLMDSPLFIGAYNQTIFGTPSTNPVNHGSKQCAFSSIGDGLNNTQIGDFYTAVQAFQTTLSRQV
tara:strand:- start:1336 stop:2214 length:879 start_codon:yes stop_codon:yes gene_type:complete